MVKGQQNENAKVLNLNEKFVTFQKKRVISGKIMIILDLIRII